MSRFNDASAMTVDGKAFDGDKRVSARLRKVVRAWRYWSRTGDAERLVDLGLVRKGALDNLEQ